MARFLLVVALATILPLGGPGAYAQGDHEAPHAVAGAADSGVPRCCAPDPAAGDVLPCAGPGASCPAAVLTDASLDVSPVADAVPAAGAPGHYLAPALDGLFRPPIVTRA